MRREVSHPVGIGDVRAWLEAGARVALYIRHAERPPLDPGDPTFGERLALTGPGERQARAVGEALRGAVREVRLLASPMERTRRTVQLIAEGAGMGAGLPVEDAPAIGVDNVFLNPRSVHLEMQRVGAMRFQLAYLAAGEAPHARPVAEATHLAVNWIRKSATAQLNLFGSHDITITATLAGLQLARFTEADWIPYLTGLAMVERDGAWSNHWFV